MTSLCEMWARKCVPFYAQRPTCASMYTVYAGSWLVVSVCLSVQTCFVRRMGWHQHNPSNHVTSHIMHAQPPMPPTASRCSFLHLACALVAAPVHLLFSFAWQRYHVRGSGGCTYCVKSPLQMLHTLDLFAAGRVLHRSTPMRCSSDRTTSNWLKAPLHIATDTYIPRHRHCRLVPHLFITSRCSLRRLKARRERPSI